MPSAIATMNLGRRHTSRMSGIGSASVQALAAKLMSEAIVVNDLAATFSRANPVATDPVTGLQIPHNLQTESQSIGNWGVGNLNRSSNVEVAPDGTTTAERITEDTTAGVQHYVTRTVNFTAAQPYTLSIYVKAGSGTRNVWLNSNLTGSYENIIVNPSTGEVVQGGAGWSVAVTSIGNWHRVACTVTAAGTAAYTFSWGLADGTAITYTGDGTSSLYLWGAQVNRGSTPTAYVITTTAAVDGSNVRRRIPLTIGMRQVQGDLIEGSRQNLCTYSQKLDDASWTGTTYADATAVASAFPAPDGTMTAWDLTDNSAVAYQEKEKGVTVANDGATYCISVYVRKTTNAPSAFGINLALTGGTAVSNTPRLNTNTGTLGGYVNAGVDDVGAYWRVWCSITNNSSGNTTLKWYLFPAAKLSSGGGDTATAIGTATVWGVQVEPGAFPSSYIPTTSAAVTRSADSLSVALSSLVDSRTNLLTYSQQCDNAVWAKNQATVTADATTAPDGTTTADKMVEDGTTSVHWVGNVVAGITSGQTYTFSVYVKAGERTAIELFTTAGGNIAMGFDLAGGTSMAAVTGGYAAPSSSSIVAAGDGFYRCSITISATGTGSYFFGVILRSGASTNYAGNGTSGVYSWGAQVSQTAAAIEYIPTTATAITTGPTGLSYDHGTMVSVWVPYGHQANTGAYAYMWGNATSDYVGSAFVNSGGTVTVRRGTTVAGNGALKDAPTGLNLSSRAASTVAQTWASGDNRLFVNGAQQASGAGTTFPADALTTAYIGSNNGAGNYAFGYVAVLYWPRALAASEVAALDASIPFRAPALAA